jgi:hypothetical protein
MRSLAAPGPRARWFIARALDGWAPKLALFDAVLSTVIAVVVAATWRAAGGPRAAFENIVPMLGTGLRWSVAAPLAWGALGALNSDREAGLLDLACRRGISARRWILGRAVGAGTVVALAVGGPMIVVSCVIAGFGGGVEGVLARLSLVLPSVVTAFASGLVFWLGAVAVSAIVPSRPLALGVVVAGAAVGALVDLALPGLLGTAAHQIASPFMALEDLQAALFAEPRSAAKGLAAAVGIVLLSLLGVHAATLSFEQERAEGRA